MGAGQSSTASTTALQRALTNGDWEAVDKLLGHLLTPGGGSSGAATAEGAPPPVPVVTELDWNALDADQRSLLVLIVRSPLDFVHKERLVRLVASRMSEHTLDQEDRRGWTALHYAAKHGQLLMVNVLIELHLNVFAQDVSGRTPRQVAQESEHLLTSACMQLLHKAEAAARARMEADLGREAPEEDALQPYSVSVARRVVAAGHTLDLTIRAPVTHSDADFLQVYVPAFEGSWNLRARMGSYVIVPQGSPVKVAMPIGTVPAGSTLRVLYMRSDLEMAVAASDLIAVVDPVLLGAADDSDSLFPWPSSSAKGDSSNGGSLSKMRRAKFPWTIGPMEVPDMELLLKTNRLLEIKLAALLKDRKAFVVGATAFKDKHPELFAPITSDSSLGKEPEAPVSAPVVASDASPAAAPGPASAPATVLVNDPLADAYPDLANIALEELPYLDKVRSKLVPTFVSDQLFWLHLLHHINDVKETIIRVATTAVKSPTAKSKSNVPPPIPAPVIAAPLASNATATAPIVTAAAAKATVSEPQPQQHPEPEPAPQKIIPLDQLSTADIVALVKEDRVKAISFEWQNNLDEALELLSTYPNLDALRFKLVPGRINEMLFWKAIWAVRPPPANPV